MRDFNKILTERLSLIKNAGIAASVQKALAAVAERGAEPVAQIWRKGIPALPYAGAAVGGGVGYKKGKQMLEARRRKKLIRQAMRQQKYGSLEKRAALSPDVKKMLYLSALIPAASIGTTAIVEGVRRAYHAVQKGKRFREMLSVDAGLQREAKENPEHVRMTFDALHRMNPDFAGNPLVASTFVRNALDTRIGDRPPAIDVPTATSLVGSAPKATSISESVGPSVMMGMRSASTMGMRLPSDET